MRKVLFFLLPALLWAGAGFAQDRKEAQWSYRLSRTALQPGDEAELIFTAKLEKGWQLYSTDFKADIGPQPTRFEFVSNGTFEVLGDVTPVSPLHKKDKTWEIDVSFFTRQAEFRQKVRIDKLDYFFTGFIHGQLCNEKNGVCIPFRQAFQFDPTLTP
jgi:hypothetical protein